MDDHIVNNPFSMDCVPDSSVDWYLNRMRASGITESIAKLCGLYLRMDDWGAYFKLPYFTFEGTQTTYVRHRYRDCRLEAGPTQSSGNFKGKYWQPKGSKNLLYWPPIENQKNQYYDVEVPLIVCEGELKAIACKMHCRKNSIEALVVGVPGTKLPVNVLDDLRSIPCSKSGGDTRRTVYIAMDWNAKGQSKERAAQLEFDLKQLFQLEGANCVYLRWLPPDGHEGHEQKLDDWLVQFGGDLSAAMTESNQRKDVRQTAQEEIWDYLNSHYAIHHGKFIPLSNMTQKYGIGDLEIMENGCILQTGPKTFLPPHKVWALQPHDQRNVVDGLTFLPFPLGQDPERYVYEDGKRLLNTAPDPHWHSPPWARDTPLDVGPFVDLIQRLCQDSAEWFMDFLAQCAQYPAIRGPHIVIFQDDGGTGKSRLFETLDLVFGRYSGPIGDALTSGFNDALEHLVIAWWSDPVIKGGANRDLESAFKNFSGDSKIIINHKFGLKYAVKSYGRLMVATNKKWLVPVDDKERRYDVFGGVQPMLHGDAGKYMNWLNAGGVEAIQEFLVNRDISAFDVFAPGPRTNQRVAMEKASAIPFLGMLEGDNFDWKDIWSTAEMIRYYETYNSKISPEAAGRLLSGKYPLRIIKLNGVTTRVYAIRNGDEWEKREPAEWRKENAKQLPKD